MVLTFLRYRFLILFLALTACGSTQSESSPSTPLTGTPFDGKTTGDSFSWSAFRQGDYKSDSVDAVPIPVFLAYFTTAEEETIKEGIAIANQGVGFEAFQITSSWQNQNRVIYKVDQIGDPENGFAEEAFAENPAITLTSDLLFDGKSSAAKVIVDWQIELRDSGIDKWYVAHELGHAFGLPHALIDYNNDTLTNLEKDSLMQGDVFPDNPQLTDYNFMMKKQGEILLQHLGQKGS